ncbi:holin family protein [Endozoicomonas euniceicola]|uniref:Holin family protein n=1 Tax=Endozoicomonas euniceicola TaxID=1234143 RepID=A0ABY6GUZ5_9GAMM|nr:holin family protein [Endozoicomonas euniceicola]UYM16209.1 holin family protein [Endozoicomonas euniceicola]
MSWAGAIPVLGTLIERVLPDKAKQDEAKQKLANMIVNGELSELSERAGVIKAEAQGDSWLQRSWRPIVMLVFTTLIVCRWLGWSAPDLSEAVELKLFSIVQLGIGGYIASRGIEKVADKLRR